MAAAAAVPQVMEAVSKLDPQTQRDLAKYLRETAKDYIEVQAKFMQYGINMFPNTAKAVFANRHELGTDISKGTQAAYRGFKTILADVAKLPSATVRTLGEAIQTGIEQQQAISRKLEQPPAGFTYGQGENNSSANNIAAADIEHYTTMYDGSADDVSVEPFIETVGGGSWFERMTAVDAAMMIVVIIFTAALLCWVFCEEQTQRLKNVLYYSGGVVILLAIYKLVIL